MVEEEVCWLGNRNGFGGRDGKIKRVRQLFCRSRMRKGEPKGGAVKGYLRFLSLEPTEAAKCMARKGGIKCQCSEK